MTDHPITPPPELVKQWWKEAQAADYMDLPCWVTLRRHPRRPMGRRPGTGGVLCIA
jgi:hypothetical protein